MIFKASNYATNGANYAQIYINNPKEIPLQKLKIQLKMFIPFERTILVNHSVN